jgi:hypothetical protein
MQFLCNMLNCPLTLSLLGPNVFLKDTISKHLCNISHLKHLRTMVTFYITRYENLSLTIATACRWGVEENKLM